MNETFARLKKMQISAGLLTCVVMAAAIAMSGCGLDQKGMVLFNDPAYRASVIGTERDGFTVADGILWKNGRFYVADEGGRALRIWNGPAKVSTLSDSSSGILSPEDLAVDAQGNIYFTDDDTGGVWKVNERGETEQLVTRDQGLLSTEGIVLAPDGDLLVGDGESHKVFRVTPAGEVSVFLGEEYGIGKPETMAFDDNGGLYIGDNDANVLYMLTPDKKLHRVIEAREGFAPETIWFANGVLYMTDSSNGKLFSYTALDGLQTIAVFGGKLHAANGLTTDDAGNIYVSIQTDLKRKIGYILKIEHN